MDLVQSSLFLHLFCIAKSLLVDIKCKVKIFNQFYFCTCRAKGHHLLLHFTPGSMTLTLFGLKE